MIAHELESFLNGTQVIKESQDDEFDIPLNISDIIDVCREYTKLTWQMQSQIESILELGIEESIKSNIVQRSSLPHIKSFLRQICSNAYFGDATYQAKDCINLIEKYENSCLKIASKVIYN